MQKTKFFVIMGPFFPFDPPYNWKNQNFEKMKKNPGNIIILHSCTTNSRHMMYGSWDIKCNWHNFLLFWAIFLPFYPAPANNAENLNFEKIKKASRGIIILYISTINKKNQMIYDSWYGALQTELFLILHQLLHFLPWS